MLDAYRDLIDELLHTPNQIRTAIGDADSASADTIRLVDELRVRDDLVLERLQRMRSETNVHLRAMPTTLASKDAGNPAAVMLGFDHARGELVSLLMNLTLKDWERVATHEITGEISISDEVEEHVEFDEIHRELILTASKA